MEGVEWPVISAMVAVNPNSPAAATIQIVPADSAMDIKPRSLVFLFFRDYWEGKSDLSSLTDVYKGVKVEEIPEAEDAPLESYRLLFAGEIVGIGYQKSATGRSMTLSCLDFSLYWDTCWYFKGASIFGEPSKGAWADAGGKTLHDIFLGTGEMIYKVLKDAPLGYEVYAHKDKKSGKRVVESQIPGLLGGIIGLLQAIGGIYKGGRKIMGVSKFFALAELRLKLSQQMGVYPDDGPHRLLKTAGFGDIWDKSIKGLGKQFNFRQAIMALSRYIFYEVYPNPTARYIRPTGVFDQGPQGPSMMKSHPSYAGMAAEALGMSRTIADWRDRCLHTDVPKSELKLSITAMMQNCLVQAKIAHTDIKKAHKAFMSASGFMKQALSLLDSRAKENGQFWRKMSNAEDRLRSIINMTVPGHRSEVAKSTPEFLYSQLFRPDLWFCSPPRCNVIFPDQYESLSYSRNFIQEVTRLLLRTPNVFSGYDAMWDKYVYAPLVLGITEDKKLIKKDAGIPLHVMRDLMEHELYTGVLPHQERAKGLNVYGLKDGKVQEGEYKVGYLQRLANFLFYKYRYSTRTLSVNGPFNPFVVAGFPAIVLDRPTNVEQQRNLFREFTKNRDQYAREASDSRVLIRRLGVGEDLDTTSMYSGTHYLGEIVSITHQLTQAGGRTAITMGYARTHREQVDPVGTELSEEQIKRYKKETEKFKKSVVAAYQEPKTGGRGLYGGEIMYVEEREGATGPFPLLGTSQTSKKGFMTKVDTNVSKKARDFGEEAVAKAGDPDAVIEFLAYEIIEKMWKEEGDANMHIPFEASVRPAWYGSCWYNEKIGTVYQQLLGTGAVTDPISIGNTGIAPEASETEEGLEAVAEQDGAAEDETAGADAVISIEAGSTIAEAIDFLDLVYSRVRTGGYSADSFIHSYVWRPIASMTEIMGTTALKFDGQGKVTEGFEGFFSRAFGDYKDLFLLVDDEVSSIIGVQRGEDASARLDIRRERRLRSIAYVTEILDRAMRG